MFGIIKPNLVKFSGMALVMFFVCASTYASRIPAPCVINEQTVAELKAAKQATSKYHDILAAEGDQYGDANLPIPHMGEHFVNNNLINDGGVFDPAEPEALVYQNTQDGGKRLVAVEYLVNIADYPLGPPEGFSGDCDQWDTFGGVFRTLHAWIWAPNPDGVFSEFNPRFD